MMKWLAGTAMVVAMIAFGPAAFAAEERHLAQHGDVRIEYFARGQGPRIVLLPSVGRGAEDFADLAARLAASGFRVLRPQPRGVGASAGPVQNLTLRDFARDVAAVIESDGGGPTVVAGHAYGNWIARVTAIEHPALVRGVMVIAAAKKGPIPKDMADSIRLASDPTRPDAERLEHLRRVFFAPGSDAAHYLTGWYPNVLTMQRAAAAATQPQSQWWGAGNKVPVLDLKAELDPLAPPASVNELRDELGDRVTVVVIPGASHALVPEQPAAVTEAIARWVRSLPAQ